MIQIDRNIPMPLKLQANVSPVYPWAELEIGESFAFSRQTCSPLNSATKAGKRLNRTFRVMRHGSVYRCWRTA